MGFQHNIRYRSGEVAKLNKQGLDPQRFQIIPRTLIFLTRRDSVLLLKGSPQKKLYANLFNGIGGHVERGEDVLSAARRELLEEAGLAPGTIRLVGTVTIETGGNLGICLFVFRGSGVNSDPFPSKEWVPSPEGNPEWIRVSDLENVPLVEDLYTILPRVLDHRPGDAPFSAHISEGTNGGVEITFGE